MGKWWVKVQRDVFGCSLKAKVSRGWRKCRNEMVGYGAIWKLLLPGHLRYSSGRWIPSWKYVGTAPGKQMGLLHFGAWVWFLHTGIYSWLGPRTMEEPVYFNVIQGCFAVIFAIAPRRRKVSKGQAWRLVHDGVGWFTEDLCFRIAADKSYFLSCRNKEILWNVCLEWQTDFFLHLLCVGDIRCIVILSNLH